MFFFLPPPPKLFHSCCQATHSCSDGETLSLLVSILPLCIMFSYPLNPKDTKMLSAPLLHLSVFLQLGLLPSYSLHLLAKPFGVLTKCLPRLLLRNVHMHMRVMNNASLYAHGLVCK